AGGRRYCVGHSRVVHPGHDDQPVGHLLVGGDQREAKANVSLSAEIRGTRHGGTPPIFSATPKLRYGSRLTVQGMAFFHTPRRARPPCGSARGRVVTQGPNAGRCADTAIERCPWPLRTPAAPPAAGRRRDERPPHPPR